jgi:transcriptional regulator GlxA family with amidase domain
VNRLVRSLSLGELHHEARALPGRWARDHLKEGFSPQHAADALATSTRTLQRRCEAVLGKSRYPASRICGLTAQGLLRGSDLDINVIAAEVGYLEARDAKNSFANVWDEASATFALAPR